MKICTFSERETERLGELIAHCLKGKEVIFITGALGVGKTVLGRGIAKGSGVERNLRSSSFVLLSQYKGKRFNIYHVDLYRLEKEEFLELGLEELLGEGVIIVEWADKIEDLLKPSLSIKISMLESNSRIIEVSGERELTKCIEGEIKRDAHFSDRHLMF